jgi:hypothetical protein
MNDTPQQLIVPEARVERAPVLRAEPSANPLDNFIMRASMDASIDADKLAKLLAMRREELARLAEGAFINALAHFKAKVPRIAKDKNVSFPSRSGGTATSYWHATLGGITGTIDPVLGEVGLSYRWLTEQQDGGTVKVTCIVTHIDGHSERTSLIAGRDDSGNKNNIQQLGSAVKYLQRYTLMSALGLSDSEDEDDGRGTEPTAATISAQQLQSLEAMMQELGVDQAQFLTFLKIEKLAELPAAAYSIALSTLEARRRRAPPAAPFAKAGTTSEPPCSGATPIGSPLVPLASDAPRGAIEEATQRGLI